MKEVAALLSKEASEGLATDSLGVRAANLAVKACATAGHSTHLEKEFFKLLSLSVIYM